jgi:hypothetical protein
MIIKTAQDWWASYAQNISYFRWIARAVGLTQPGGFAELPFTPLQNIETFDIETAYSQLQNVWAKAPDHPIIYKWKNWGELCDLCSEFDSEFIGELSPYVERVKVSSSMQRKIDLMLHELAQNGVQLGPNDRVAGGWPRDLLRGVEANDIDVFVESNPGISPFNTFLQMARKDQDDSGSNPVIKTLVRLETASLPIQVIEVGPSPVGYIRTFDAFCNMLGIDRNGELYSYHKSAVTISMIKRALLGWRPVFQRNPITSCSPEKLELRAKKFEARGFTLDRFSK